MKRATFKLAFLRHSDYQQTAHTPSALQHGALTPLGVQQAQAAAEELLDYARKHHLTLHPEIDASQSLRAWQTAEVLRQTLNRLTHYSGHCIEYTALHERSVGSFANLSVTDIEACLQADPRVPHPPMHWKSDSDYRLPCPYAESLMEAGQRVADHLTQTLNTLASSSDAHRLKLIVGHGASFRHAAYHLGALKREEIAQKSMHHARPLIFECHLDDGHQVWSLCYGEWKTRSRTAAHTDKRLTDFTDTTLID
ncbi:MAG: histidine phosphatase family protein [Hydrogenovibrio sp.]